MMWTGLSALSALDQHGLLDMATARVCHNPTLTSLPVVLLSGPACAACAARINGPITGALPAAWCALSKLKRLWLINMASMTGTNSSLLLDINGCHTAPCTQDFRRNFHALECCHNPAASHVSGLHMLMANAVVCAW